MNSTTLVAGGQIENCTHAYPNPSVLLLQMCYHYIFSHTTIQR